MSLIGPSKISVYEKKKSAVCRPIPKKNEKPVCKKKKKVGEKSARHTGPTSAYVYSSIPFILQLKLYIENIQCFRQKKKSSFFMTIQLKRSWNAR